MIILFLDKKNLFYRYQSHIFYIIINKQIQKLKIKYKENIEK